MAVTTEAPTGPSLGALLSWSKTWAGRKTWRFIGIAVKPPLLQSIPLPAQAFSGDQTRTIPKGEFESEYIECGVGAKVE
jgi:hypothetical protein